VSKEAKVEELEFVRSKHGGVLRPEDVVEFARDERTALHGDFQWDDTEAAQQFRLWQARQVIRLVITIVDSPAGKQLIPMYVSLVSDRQQPGGGYRPLVDVMNAEDLRDELLRQALAELKTVRKKYQQLQELRPIFRAIEKVEAKTQRQPV
jgi:hypothetical protein